MDELLFILQTNLILESKRFVNTVKSKFTIIKFFISDLRSVSVVN